MAFFPHDATVRRTWIVNGSGRCYGSTTEISTLYTNRLVPGRMFPGPFPGGINEAKTGGRVLY